MKRLLLLIPLVLASAPVSGTVDPKVAEFCMRAADFSGCVKTMTGGSSKESNLPEAEQKLLDEIKKLPNRMTRTSLSNFQANVRDFSDALSLAKFESPDSQLVRNSEKLLLAFDILYEQWRKNIRAEAENWSHWKYYENLKAKTSLDRLLGGNTFAIRCRDVQGLFHWVRDWSDPIFAQTFTVVELAARQLAERGEFSFPAMEDGPLIPLQVPENAGFGGQGLGTRKCKSVSPQPSSQPSEVAPKKEKRPSGRDNF